MLSKLLLVFVHALSFFVGVDAELLVGDHNSVVKEYNLSTDGISDKFSHRKNLRAAAIINNNDGDLDVDEREVDMDTEQLGEQNSIDEEYRDSDPGNENDSRSLLKRQQDEQQQQQQREQDEGTQEAGDEDRDLHALYNRWFLPEPRRRPYNGIGYRNNAGYRADYDAPNNYGYNQNPRNNNYYDYNYGAPGYYNYNQRNINNNYMYDTAGYRADSKLINYDEQYGYQPIINYNNRPNNIIANRNDLGYQTSYLYMGTGTMYQVQVPYAPRRRRRPLVYGQYDQPSPPQVIVMDGKVASNAVQAGFKKPTSPRPTLPPVPTFDPTFAPTANPTINPTFRPSKPPTKNPTRTPTLSPTRNPTPVPSRKPTPQPTTRPTRNPTARPTKPPTKKPTNVPTRNPTRQPTIRPTPAPAS